LVNRILATVIISILPCFYVWQFSAVCISCKTHSRTIHYVFRPTSVWLVITRVLCDSHERKASSLVNDRTQQTCLISSLNGANIIMNKLFNDVISVGFCSKNLIFLGNVSSNDYTNTKFNRLDSLKGYTCVHRVSSLK